MAEKGRQGPPSPEDQINEQIERNRSFERSAEAALDRVASTTLPFEIRMAVRDAEFDFVDAPPGLGDNWGIQRLYAGLEERRRFLARLHPVNKTTEAEARRAIGLEVEPWRDTPIVTLQDETEIMRRSRNQGMPPEAINDLVKKTKANALERVPIIIKELPRAREELVRVRKVYFLYWNFKNAASGNEVGELYLQSKVPNLPLPRDFALMLKMPSYFMTEEESSLSVPDPSDPSRTITKLMPDYPKSEEVKAFLAEEKRSEENEPTGETTEKEARLLYLVALSENPERVMKWKLRTEQAELFKIYKEKGVSPAYLILKEKGIDYIDPGEEAKIQAALNSLTVEEKATIKNAWWKSLGFRDEANGINEIGDPEKWIPTKARRGDPPAGAPAYFGTGFDGKEFDRKKQIGEIGRTLVLLKNAWQQLSPLSNLSAADKQRVMGEINKLTDYIRGLTTYSEVNASGELIPKRDAKGNIVTTFGSLSLERELEIRKGAVKIGCIWSKPQRIEEKESVMNDMLGKYVHGDTLAFENAKLMADLFGFTAKWSYYARDFDPGKPLLQQWAVDAEAWPYTSEFQNILALPWYQRYKAEAGGPIGSRGRFGPLMTDYLSAYSSPELGDDKKPIVDEHGDPMYVVVDKNGEIRFGRADEGVVLTDLSFTLLEHWERGESLSETGLWDGVVEDPLRRFLLRSFFAEGKVALGPGGNSLLDIWKRREWKLEDLDSDKFWDDYKLARKVVLREELFNEDVWVEVVRPIDEIFRKEAGEIAVAIRNELNPNKRLILMQRGARLYGDWKVARKQEIFDYSDQMFWNGVASTEGRISWERNEPGILEKPRQEMPSATITRIIKRAKACSVNLIGKHSDQNLMKGVMKG